MMQIMQTIAIANVNSFDTAGFTAGVPAQTCFGYVIYIYIYIYIYK